MSDDLRLEVSGETLLRLRVDAENHLLLSLIIYDDSGNVLLLVDSNEWLAGDPALWDFQSDWQRLTVRKAQGDVRLRLDAKRDPMRVQALLTKDGNSISLTSRGVAIKGQPHEALGPTGLTLQGLTLVRMKIVVDPEKGKVGFEPHPIPGGDIIVSHAPRSEVLRKAARQLARRKAEEG